MVFFAVSGYSQRFTETVKLEYNDFQVLILSNVNGSISVEGYTGDKILFEVDRMLDGKNRVDIESLKKDVTISEIVEGDSLIIYIKGLGNCFCAEEGKYGWNSRYRYNWNDWDNDFDYKFDFTIKVPTDTDLNLSTINNGDIQVSNSNGELNIKNVNGGIFMKQVSGSTKARTINGDLVIDYSSNPTSGSTYYTLNGDIKANFKKDLNAMMTFKSFNGELFTNINEIEYVPLKVEKFEKENEKGISYKVGGKTEVKIRNGGLYLDFETFNGNVIVKEI